MSCRGRVLVKLVRSSDIIMAVVAVVLTMEKRRRLKLEIFTTRRKEVVLGHIGKEGGRWRMAAIHDWD